MATHKLRAVYFALIACTIAVAAVVTAYQYVAGLSAQSREERICSTRLQEDLTRLGVDRARLTFGVRVENKKPKRVWLYFALPFGPPDSTTDVDDSVLDDPTFKADVGDQLYPAIEKYVSESIRRQGIFATSKPYTAWVQGFVFTDSRCGKVMRQWVNDDSAKSGLLASLRMGDEEGMKLALEAGENVNAVDDDGNTALTNAARRGAWGLVRFLLQAGANPNVTDAQGQSPLELAAIEDDVHSVQFLITDHADVNHQNKAGQTALEHVCVGSDFAQDDAPILLSTGSKVTSVENRTQIVRLLIQNGANVNTAAMDGWTPLHGAALWGDTETVKVLLAAGADPNARNKRGDRPLDIAALRCLDGKGEVCRQASEILRSVTK